MEQTFIKTDYPPRTLYFTAALERSDLSEEEKKKIEERLEKQYGFPYRRTVAEAYAFVTERLGEILNHPASEEVFKEHPSFEENLREAYALLQKGSLPIHDPVEEIKKKMTYWRRKKSKDGALDFLLPAHEYAEKQQLPTARPLTILSEYASAAFYLSSLGEAYLKSEETPTLEEDFYSAFYHTHKGALLENERKLTGKQREKIEGLLDRIQKGLEEKDARTLEKITREIQAVYEARGIIPPPPLQKALEEGKMFLTERILEEIMRAVCANPFG